MRISNRKLQDFRQHFANEVVFYCGALGLIPADFEFGLEVAKGVLTVSGICHPWVQYSERMKVGSMELRFQQHLLASLKAEVDEAFKGSLEPLAEAA